MYGSSSTDGSIPGRIVPAGHDEHAVGPLGRRLSLWAAFFALLLAAARLTVRDGGWVPDRALIAAALAFCGCGGLGAAVYCFAAFLFFKQVRFALAAVAFFALCSGFWIQMAADLFYTEPALYDWILLAASLIASVAFVGASYSHTALEVSGRLRVAVLAVLAGALVLAFPLAVLAYALDMTTLHAFSAEPARALIANAAESAVCVVALVMTGLALARSYKRYVTERDRPSAVFCFYLVPFVFTVIARFASSARFDAWSVCSGVMTVASWLLFVVAVGAENAMAHREVRDRIEEMEAMHQVSWSLVGATSSRELLDMLANTIRERLSAGIATVYLADEARESLITAAVSGPDECADSLGKTFVVCSADRRPGFHSGHTARAFVTREVQVAEDVFVDVEFVPWKVVAGDDGCAISLPLVGKGEAIGVLNVYFHDRRQLTPQRMKLLMTVAAAASPAIEHAQSREATAGAVLNRAA